jgi:AcrR family transcriptional regulator
MAERQPKERLARIDWVQATIEAVRVGGTEGASIDQLCRTLGVTKGSFYHHFGSRQELVAAVAEYWARTQPELARALLASLRDEPEVRLAAMVGLFTDGRLGQRDRAMRAWSASEPIIEGAVAAADAQVLAILEALMKQLGLDKPAQQDYARMLMVGAVGFYGAPHLVARGGRKRVAERLLALIRDAARKSADPRKPSIQFEG